MSAILRVLKERWRPGFRFDSLPSHFVDWLPHLSPAAIACYLVIVRHTFGFRKYADAISASQFEKETGYSRSMVSPGLKMLEENYLIRVTRKHRQISVYEPLPTAQFLSLPQQWFNIVIRHQIPG